ncbi:ASCH domain-containing protein [Pelagibius litoralis]|uniref:ASCH domain-containing protein n=1 Tax=Pelagibius litoralis TaxID=374515 RepID=A0A967EWJ9_9PROT|nr:ASCH domain-containing protein [Pelagibius litoralis]NIA67173.1 ASCH domain-containing protein [Pelagibius litoralis]
MSEAAEVAAYRVRMKADLGLEADTVVEAFRFGDSPDLADQLVELVVSGPKRATVGWIADAELDGEVLAEVGDHFIVLDGAGRPRCTIRVTETRRGSLLSADEAFAWDEGEGDRTLAWWLDGHREFFARRSVEIGLPFDEAESELLFERFEVVHRAG